MLSVIISECMDPPIESPCLGVLGVVLAELISLTTEFTSSLQLLKWLILYEIDASFSC